MSRRKRKALSPTRTVAPWQPLRLFAVPHQYHAGYENAQYVVLVRVYAPVAPFGECVHLSIRRQDRQPVRDWRDLQRIKNELLGPECEAVELYPAESRVVDTANQYHLWAFPTYRFPFGYAERLVLDAPDAHAAGAVQRPVFPDL